MSELLFKLKKDGKCVGYCEWTEGGWEYYNDLNPESKFTHFMVVQTGLTAHPYVTTDKHGAKVFAGDRIKFVFEQGTYRDINGLSGIIKKDNFKTWVTLKCRMAQRDYKKEYYPEQSEWQHLELIETKP